MRRVLFRLFGQVRIPVSALLSFLYFIHSFFVLYASNHRSILQFPRFHTGSCRFSAFYL